jgi:hypothetical protein
MQTHEYPSNSTISFPFTDVELKSGHATHISWLLNWQLDIIDFNLCKVNILDECPI